MKLGRTYLSPRCDHTCTVEHAEPSNRLSSPMSFFGDELGVSEPLPTLYIAVIIPRL